MTAGISIESYADVASFAGGSFHVDYPVSNLGDLIRSTKVARATGACTFTASFAAAPVRFVALVNHTLQPGDTVRVQAGAYDSGTVLAWPGAYSPLYRGVRPFLFPAEISVSSVTVTISAAADIGGLEIARFWTWPGLSPGAEVGVRNINPTLDYVGGGQASAGLDLPRKYDGQIDRIAMAQAADRGLSFQGLKGVSRPFVFLENFEVPDTWPRGCFLARNVELTPSVGAVYRHDTFQIRSTEWMR